jgi:uncharacterized protein
MTDESPRNPFAPTLVAVICHDGPDSQPARKAAAQAHLHYVESILDRLALAGPLYDDAGERMLGSIYLFKTVDVAEARRLLEADPYFAAGFWRSIEYLPFLPAAGELVGGTTWRRG